MNFIRYHVVHAKVVILYMIALCPLIMLSDYLGKQAGLHLAVLAVKILIGLWLVVSLWMSYQTSQKILFEDMTLTKATVASLDDARPYLAFLPVVGRFFKAREKEKETGDGSDPGDCDNFFVEGRRVQEQTVRQQSTTRRRSWRKA